ncbi:MAG: YdcF family protein [Planctomycetes bacterium]|nr:YdcF family protein [Planctomycetota bacterium]
MDFAKTLLVPPALCFVAIVLGFAIVRWRRRLGRIFVAGGLITLWAASAPIVAGPFLRSLQVDPPLRPDAPLPEADAIVVLSAGVAREADEFGGPSVDRITLERIRYAAALHRRSQKPVMVCGGPGALGEPPVAELMARTLEAEFGIDVRWREVESADTAANARRAAEMLAADGITSAYVVTHAWHMPRARQAFAKTKLAIVAAPTGYRAPQRATVEAFFPNAKALHESAWACHEWIGRLWYVFSG